MEKLFWLAIIALETVGAGLFFRVALENKLVPRVITCAWVLGGCCLGCALLVTFQKFYPKKNQG